MKVILGNPSPQEQGRPLPGPALTHSEIRDTKNEDGSYIEGYVVGSNAAEVKDHLFDNPGLVTHLPGNGAALSVVRSWADQSGGKPSFVKVEPGERDPAEADDFERFLSEFWHCDRGIPADVEDTHFTAHSDKIYAPGEKPEEG